VQRVVGAFHLAGELGFDLEELAKVLIQRIEQLIEARVADDHDLDIERDRLRLQARRSHQAIELGHLLDLDLVVAKSTLEPVIGEGVHQQVLGFHHQVAAVGAVQRTGANLGKVRDHRPIFGPVLDPADEVVVGGVIFDDDRGLFLRGALHQHIDRIAG